MQNIVSAALDNWLAVVGLVIFLLGVSNIIRGRVSVGLRGPTRLVTGQPARIVGAVYALAGLMACASDVVWKFNPPAEKLGFALFVGGLVLIFVGNFYGMAASRGRSGYHSRY